MIGILFWNSLQILQCIKLFRKRRNHLKWFDWEPWKCQWIWSLDITLSLIEHWWGKERNPPLLYSKKQKKTLLLKGPHYKYFMLWSPEEWREGGGGQIDSRDSWGRSQLWQSHQEGLFVCAMYSICSVQGIHTTMHCLVLCAELGLRERTQEGLTARGESATAKEGRICYVDDDHWNFADVTRVLFRIICFSICLIWKVGLGDVRKTQLRQLASSCVQSVNLQQCEWILKRQLCHNG